MTGSSGEVHFRLARADDLAATYQVFLAATNDLRGRTHRPPVVDTPARSTRALAFRRHALAHDGQRLWVAEAHEQVVGFGVATLRQDLWYLAALHVRPGHQGGGVGRELLRRCLASAPGRHVVRTTITDSGQPVSNALYARHGLYQLIPLLHLDGPTRAGPLAAQLSAQPVTPRPEARAMLDAIDTAVVGVTRPMDHQHWQSQPDMFGLLCYAHDQVIGYAYVSSYGSLGPAAARSTAAMQSVLALSLRAAAERGVDHIALPVPGLCRSGMAYLLANGFRFGESINLVLASRPFGHLDRYLPSGGDALF